MGTSPQRLVFGRFTLDPSSLELEQDGRRVALPPQPARILVLLASRAGELVAREEIRRHVWGDQAVEFDAGLHSSIRQIRRALDDSPSAPSYIETVPRRGYRFLAPVRPAGCERRAAARPRWSRPALGGLAALVLASLLVVATHWRWPDRSAATPEPVRLVVLPFDDLLPEGDPAVPLVRAFGEEVRTELSRLDPERLGVIARTSSRRMRQSDASVQEMGRRLGVTHLLEGSVRRIEGGLSVTVQLVRVEDQVQVWADRLVRAEAEGDFALEVAQRVTNRLVPELLPALDHRPLPATTVPRAVRRATLEARYLLQERSPEAAAKRLREALESAPHYAQAHALLAEANLGLGRWEEAEVEARRALELDPGQAGACRVLGDVELYGRLRVSAAGPWYTRAAGLAPADPDVLMAQAWWLVASGDTETAIEAMRAALRWDPVSPMIHGDAPWFLFYARRFDEALVESERSLELLPEPERAMHFQLSLALVRRDSDEVRRLAAELGKGEDAGSHSATGKEEAGADPIEDLLHRNIAVLSAGTDRRSRYSSRARMYALLGETERAFDDLERALDRREVDLIWLAADPHYDGLRRDPRFEEILSALDSLPSD